MVTVTEINVTATRRGGEIFRLDTHGFTSQHTYIHTRTLQNTRMNMRYEREIRHSCKRDLGWLYNLPQLWCRIPPFPRDKYPALGHHSSDNFELEFVEHTDRHCVIGCETDSFTSER